MSHPDSSCLASHYVTRFLLPFSFHNEKLGQLRERLAASHWIPKPPQDNYTADLIPAFQQSITGTKDDQRLFQWDHEQSKRRPGIEMNLRYSDKESVPAALWNRDGRDIELFLGAHGTGAISITLSHHAAGKGSSFHLGDIKAFNYRLALPPTRRGKPSKAARITKADGESYPATTLHELCHEFLSPLTADPTLGIDIARSPNSLIPFTVLCFGSGVEFSSVTRPEGVVPQDDLAGQASMLAQSFEAGHPLPIQDDHGALVRIFHTDELMAVSEVGAAILLSDIGAQPSPQKLQIRLDVYFLCFLAALLQRMRLQHLLDKAAAVMFCPPGEARYRALEQLRSGMVDTAARGNLLSVSTRDVHNRYLRLCQDAMRVPQALSLVQQTISDLDASLQAERQSDSLGELAKTQRALRDLAQEQKGIAEKQKEHTGIMAATQNKVEWIEIFLISFYSAELTELVGKGFDLGHGYLSYAVVIAMFSSGVVAAMLLKPWKHESSHTTSIEPPPRHFIVAVLVIAAVLLVFIWCGRQFPNPNAEPNPVVEELRQTRKQLQEIKDAIRESARPAQPVTPATKAGAVPPASKPKASPKEK